MKIFSSSLGYYAYRSFRLSNSKEQEEAVSISTQNIYLNVKMSVEKKVNLLMVGNRLILTGEGAYAHP